MCDEVDVEMSRLRLYLGRKVLPSHTPRTIQMRDRGVGVTHTRYNPLADYNAVPHPIKKQIVAKSCDSRAGCAPRSGEMMDGFHRPERRKSGNINHAKAYSGLSSCSCPS